MGQFLAYQQIWSLFLFPPKTVWSQTSYSIRWMYLEANNLGIWFCLPDTNSINQVNFDFRIPRLWRSTKVWLFGLQYILTTRKQLRGLVVSSVPTKWCAFHFYLFILTWVIYYNPRVQTEVISRFVDLTLSEIFKCKSPFRRPTASGRMSSACFHPGILFLLLLLLIYLLTCLN